MDITSAVSSMLAALVLVSAIAGPAVAASSRSHPAVDRTADAGGIVYSNLSVAPAPVNGSEPVTVTATLANRDDHPETYNATLEVDGRVVAFETGTLSPGGRTRVAFHHRFDAAGTHTVAVGSSASRTVSVRESGTATVSGLVLPTGSLRDEIRAFRSRTDRDLPANASVLLSRAGPYVLFTPGGVEPYEMAVVEGTLSGAALVEQGRSVPVLVGRETTPAGTDAAPQALTDPSIRIDASTGGPVAPGEATTVTVDADGVNFLLVGVPAGWSGGEIPGQYDRCGPPPSIFDPNSLEGVRNGSCEVEFTVRFTDDRTAEFAASRILDALTGNLGMLADGAVDLLLNQLGIEDKLEQILTPVFERLFDVGGIQELDNAVWVSSPNLNPLGGTDQRTSVRQSLRVGVPSDASGGTVTLPVVAADWDLSMEFTSVDLTVESRKKEPEPEPPKRKVAVTPPGHRVTTNATATYEVVLRNASGGVGTFDVNVTLGNASVASVVNATVIPGGRLTTARVGSDNDTVRLQGVGMDTADTGAVTLARVTLLADANGSTDVRLTGESVYADEAGNRYDVRLANATLIVGERTLTDLNGNGERAADIDDDGLAEDVDGDGRISVIDVSVLLAHLGDFAVESAPAPFDFSGDGRVNIIDVAALLAQT